MIPIEESSIKSLIATEPDTKYAVAKLDDGDLLHSRWFGFLFPTGKLAFAGTGDCHPQAAEWAALTWPTTAVFKQGQPLIKKNVTPSGGEETLVRFVASDTKIVAHMRGPVFDWIQANYLDPEFWVRGVDQVIAVKDNGKLIGGVGPARVK